MTADKLISTSQVMAELNVSRPTVLRLWRQGKIKGQQLGPKTLRFCPASVQRYKDPDCPILNSQELVVLRYVALNAEACPMSDESVKLFISLQFKKLITTSDNVRWQLTELGDLMFDRYLRYQEIQNCKKDT